MIRYRKPLARLLIAASTLFAPAFASAYKPKEGNISATLGWILHQTNFDSTHTGARAPYQGDVALVATGDINDVGSIEVGVYHLNKQYFRSQGFQYVGEAVETIHITMGYRHWWAPRFSTALSFASSHSMGYVTRIHDDFAPGQAINTSASDTTEYSADLSIQYDLFSYDRFTAAINGIYSLSFTGKPNEKADHYGVIIGLRYFIQEKQVVEKPRDAI